MQTPTTTHTTYFNTFIAKLVAKFQPLQIFNFSRNSFEKQNEGCFNKEPSTHQSNYCLLLVTESNTSIDHEVQDFANAHYQQGTVMVICHSKLAIDKAIAAKNRFFITVYTKGELVYGHNILLEVADAEVKAREQCKHRFALAEGFYLGASECLTSWEQYAVAVFMLHQAVKQLCIGLIRIQLDYRSEHHNLNGLLQLCTCFSQAPLQLFTAKPDDRRLFNILVKSYLAARYQPDFIVSEQDAISLCNKVAAFTALATQLGEDKIRELV